MNKQEDTRFVCICKPRDSIQAGMIRGALEDAGLHGYVNNENFATVRLGGGMGLGVGTMRVMVPADQADRARGIVVGLGIENCRDESIEEDAL